MDQPSSLDDIDRLAHKRASAKLRWYAHAVVFAGVNLMLFLMSDQGFGHRSWSIKPVLGWGLGLALHWASVWVVGSGSDLRERLVQKERDRLLRQRDSRQDGR